MLDALSVPAINRLLRANTWALDRLRPHAGKRVRLSCAPFVLRFEVAESGELAPASAEAPADTAIEVTPGLMLRIAARDDTAWNEARVAGDVELAAAIDYIRRNIAWDYEEDLSRVFGDIAAHRMATAARQLDRWSRNTVLNLAHAVAEYATYEQPMLASASAIDGFNREVDELRNDAARLEKRLALLERRLPDHPN
jgi:ubiquinone biosynthesis protein UbiJ